MSASQFPHHEPVAGIPTPRMRVPAPLEVRDNDSRIYICGSTCVDQVRRRRPRVGIGTPAMERCAPRLKIRVRVVDGRKGGLYNRADVLAALAELERKEAAVVAAGVAAARQPQPEPQPREKRTLKKTRAAT